MSLISLEPTLEIPIKKAAFASGVIPTRLAQRILIVDDDVFIRKLNSEILSKFGYQVDTAEDGEAGWKMLHAETYDLLITDNNMPKLSGVGLIRKVRSTRMTVPVILASGTVPENIQMLNLNAVLSKPFSSDELVQTVKAVLHKATF